jgi:hypothetical protein
MNCSDEILSIALLLLFFFRCSLLVGLMNSAMGRLTTAKLRAMEVRR